jgi:hypothetical protein
LKNAYKCNIIGPAADAHRVPKIDEKVKEGDKLHLGDVGIEVLETPGALQLCATPLSRRWAVFISFRYVTLLRSDLFERSFFNKQYFRTQSRHALCPTKNLLLSDVFMEHSEIDLVSA